jgi:hypothetical protein
LHSFDFCWHCILMAFIIFCIFCRYFLHTFCGSYIKQLIIWQSILKWKQATFNCMQNSIFLIPQIVSRILRFTCFQIVSQSILFSFYFLMLCLWLPGKYWIEVTRVNTSLLFQFLEELFSFFHSWAMCGCVVQGFYYVQVDSS